MIMKRGVSITNAGKHVSPTAGFRKCDIVYLFIMGYQLRFDSTASSRL